MIIFDSDFKKLCLEDQIPVLFTGADNLPYKEVFDTIRTRFLSSYKNVISFIADGTRDSRVPQVNKLTMEEYMFLKVNCGIEHPIDICDNSANGNSIRVYRVPNSTFPLGYRIQKFTYKSPITDKNLHCVAVYISSGFNKADNATRMLYDLIEAFIDSQLCDYDVHFNHLNSTECAEKVIVMDHHVTPADAMFIIRYYECILKAFNEAVNDLAFTSNFDLIYKADRPYLMPITKRSMEKLYKYIHDSLQYNEDESDFIDVCTDIYHELYYKFKIEEKVYLDKE